MFIQLLYGKSDELIAKLNKLVEEKEFLVEITVGPVRVQLMEEIGLIRKASGSLREMNIIRRAYEEILEIKWKYDLPVDRVVSVHDMMDADEIKKILDTGDK